MTYIAEHTTTNTAVPLWQPDYGIGFGGAIKRYFKKYATFNGRASLSEYWFVALFQAIISIVVGVAAGATLSWSELAHAAGQGGQVELGAGTGLIYGVYVLWTLACLLPSLGLCWRRFHDSNHSGLWILLGLIPFVGWIGVLIFMLLGPKPEGARFDHPEGP
jgi:uncharacterized membrane protein YhaH (DUF805 family)